MSSRWPGSIVHARAGAGGIGEFRGGSGPDRRRRLGSRQSRCTTDSGSSGSCGSFLSIRRPRVRKPLSSIRTEPSAASSRGHSKLSPRRQRLPGNARALVDGLAGQGHRVIAVAFGSAECAAPRRAYRRQRSATRGFGEADHRAARNGRPYRHGDGRFGDNGGGDRPQGRHRRRCLFAGTAVGRADRRSAAAYSRAWCPN